MTGQADGSSIPGNQCRPLAPGNGLGWKSSIFWRFSLNWRPVDPFDLPAFMWRISNAAHNTCNGDYAKRNEKDYTGFCAATTALTEHAVPSPGNPCSHPQLLDNSDLQSLGMSP
jgi:hypothetical protein